MGTKSNLTASKTDGGSQPMTDFGHTIGDARKKATESQPQPTTTTVDRIAGVLANKEWQQPEDYPDIWHLSAHKNHQFHGSCAICHGDLESIAQLLAPLVEQAQKEARTQVRDDVRQWVQSNRDYIEAKPNKATDMLTFYLPKFLDTCDEGRLTDEC